MSRLAFLLLASLASCGASQGRPGWGETGIVITESTKIDEIDHAVGRHVTVIGLQSRTKRPMVCGIEVDGDYDLSDRRVIAHGILKRYVVKEEDVDNTMQNRGAGTFYSLQDGHGNLARTAAD
jgi:hypothetical protein